MSEQDTSTSETPQELKDDGLERAERATKRINEILEEEKVKLDTTIRVTPNK